MNSGGPTIWLQTTTATIDAVKSGPHVKCALTVCASPNVTPACVMNAIQYLVRKWAGCCET